MHPTKLKSLRVIYFQEYLYRPIYDSRTRLCYVILGKVCSGDAKDWARESQRSDQVVYWLINMTILVADKYDYSCRDSDARRLTDVI